ncbi:MAG: glycosyltransferase involved in cell wall biosynthesis [Desulforhopalus sp.]|jgi:glycosyltransferase involved in cell wall biosynthesis
MDLSIVFATYNRDKILKRTLQSFALLDFGNLSAEIIVVDNACRAETKTLVTGFDHKLPIAYLDQSKPGKNAAINKGLSYSKGQLIVFTDDDILADEQWLLELTRAAVEFPEANVFGGAILPDWPDTGDKDFEKILDLEDNFIKVAYAITDTDFKRGVIDPQLIWGANMAVRRTAFEQHNLSFNESVGPNKNKYIMGSETDILKRLSDLGHKAVMVPEAFVYHQIRVEQLSMEWIRLRATNMGKTMVANQQVVFGRIVIGGVPLYLYKNLLKHSLLLLLDSIFSKKSMHSIKQNSNISKIKGVIFQLKLSESGGK